MRRRALATLAALVAMLIVAVPLFAQGFAPQLYVPLVLVAERTSTPELPTETPTEPPTATPTSVPTSTPTDVPPTATPTSTPVPPTPTDVPPTATPTTPPQPPGGSYDCATYDPGPTEGLRAWMSEYAPNSGDVVTTCVRLVVNGVVRANVPVQIAVRYKSTTTTYSGVTGPDGVAAIRYDTGRPTVGYTVIVEASATYSGQTYSAQTQFTPQ